MYHYLEVIKGVEAGKRYLLRDGAISIGRSSSNTIALHSGERAVSSHHAIIYKSPDRIMIQDMQSTNGTFVNEEKVYEQALSANDVIGFGKMGARLKLVVSDTELPTGEYTGAAPREDTKARTVENDDRAVQKKPPTSSTVDATKTASGLIQKARQSEQVIPQSASATLEMENKLLKNRMDADDMHELMKNEQRLDKILDRGNISEMQSSLLSSAQGARKMSRNRWVLVISIVSGLFLSIILFLGIRMMQYRQMLEKGLTLEEKLDTYEEKIFAANSNPDMNKKELARLIKELEDTKKKLTSVKGNLREDDYSKFYMDTTEKLIDDIMVRFGETDYHIPQKMVERVKYHISIYSGRMKPTINRYLKRKHTYFPMIREVFAAKRLPAELAYISMLESGFNPKALSHAGARGLWQFMPATGRSYGLQVTNTVDERCIPKKATYAAAEYFKDLIGIFGGKSSVMLAMAAYNAGEGRIMGALRKIDDPMRNRDFWYIYRMGYLAEETNEYIPRVLALMIIDENQEMFGMIAGSSSGLSESTEEDYIELDF